MTFLPTLLGAIVLLIAGWFIAKFIAKLVHRGLHAVGFERAASRSGFGDMIESSGKGWTTSWLIAQMVKWFVFLLFVVAAANLLNMPQVTQLMNEIVLFIPQLIVALIIIVLGTMLAQVAAGVVRSAVSEMGISGAGFIAKIAKYGIIAAAVVAAANQIGIATTVVNTLFIGLVATLALALGLAFGLGGRDVASRITQSWYESGQNVADRARMRAETESTERGPKVIRPTG
jgi:hypothetical protein